jgi:AraC-like DNA-binding protein
MINLQDFIDNSSLFKKFEVDDLLFVEFKCPVEEDGTSWWHNNFFAYVLSGELVLQTPQRKYILKPGECVFAKKGSVLTHHRNMEDFCELLVFVPDDFIKQVIQKYKMPLGTISAESDTIIPLGADDVLVSYFHSLLTYFPQSTPPPETLLKLKFEELIVNILSNNKHSTLKCYFSELCKSAKPSIKEIMEANFSNNLSLDQFSRLCARSLSAFKTEFKNIFHTTPGKWLLAKRLEYSRYLLETTDNTIDEVCFVCGFENISHFTRVFKSIYGIPPGKFKIQENLNKQSILS